MLWSWFCSWMIFCENTAITLWQVAGTGAASEKRAEELMGN